MKVPFLDLGLAHQALQEELQKEFLTVYNSGRFILGTKLEQFEQEFAQYSNVREAVGVASGLDALILSLRALNIGEDDEVLVPSNAYFATALAVTSVRARPVFVEPNEDTFNVNPDNIQDALTPKTKAIIPIHFFGNPCEMDQLCRVATAANIKVVEDNAQSQGAEWNGKKTGSWGDVNATSFYPTKNLGALGDAGAITTNDTSLAETIRHLRNYGGKEKNAHLYLGMNSRMDELQAAFLRVKLNYLDQWNLERQKTALFYRNRLSGIEEIKLPLTLGSAKHVYHQFVIRCDQRDSLRDHLTEKGVETGIHYPTPPYMQPAFGYLGLQKGMFPIAERFAGTSLSLPIYPGITEQQLAVVTDAVKSFFHA